MNFFSWVNLKIKKMTCVDIGLTKLAVAGFILVIAKLIPGILCIDWYWFAIIAILAAIKPVSVLFKK
jgi:hypothetical protein